MKNKVIVCGTQRCGSTMVCEDIRITNVMGRPEEYMIPWVPDNQTKWKEKYDELFKKGSTDNHVFGLKLMANQLKNADACFSSFAQPTDFPAFPHLMAVLQDAVWVWIQRRDTLDQAISHHVAKRRGYFHTIKDTGGYTPGSAIPISKMDDRTIPYDFQAIMQECNVIERGNLIWQAFFSENCIHPIVVDYDSASTEHGRRTYLNKIADNLGVHIGELPERNLEKMANQHNADLKREIFMDIIKKA